MAGKFDSNSLIVVKMAINWYGLYCMPAVDTFLHVAMYADSGLAKFLSYRYSYPKYGRVFYVSLKVGHREFIGEGATRQSARHSAAEKALRVLRTLPLPEKMEEKENAAAESTVVEVQKGMTCTVFTGLLINTIRCLFLLVSPCT